MYLLRIQRLIRRLFSAKGRELSDTSRSATGLSGRGGWLWDNSIAQYQVGDFITYWELLGDISYYQYRLMTGDGNKDFISYIIDYLRDNVGDAGLSGVSLGCSEGAAPEMTFARTGLFARFEVLDIACGLLDRQRELARSHGLRCLEYTKADLNAVVLGRERYDLIWSIGTIHHVTELESLFEQISLALKPKGIFVMREYVGPNRLQFTDKQLEVTNRLLAALPERLKRTPEGFARQVVTRPDAAKLSQTDPSESVRSADILQVMSRHLEPIRLAMTGGTLLQPLLSGIASNFDRDETGRTALRLLIAVEELLIKNGVLPSDYVFCIARSRRHVS